MQEIVVVGGGASGMAAAVAAAKEGASVTVIEHNDILGRKILSTGNGRCNLTNLDIKATDYRGDHPEFIREFLNGFGTPDALAFFSSVGISTKCRGDYVYPLCDQASAVREAFVMELKRLGVCIKTNCHVEKISRNKMGFLIYCTEIPQPVKADKVILAAGGKASEVPGSDGSGYALAKKMGHSLSPVAPALVQLVSGKKCFRKLSGIRVAAGVSLYIDGRFAAEDTGELQLTDYGISGIPVFQVSRFAAKALQQRRQVKAEIDFIPHLKKEDFREELIKRQFLWKRNTAEELLNTLFPSKLIPVLLLEAAVEKQTRAENVSGEALDRLVTVCKRFTIPVSETKPFSKAQVCAGGVRTDEVNPKTMESKLVKGLYITGELLDVDGICGGYNLHFAWGSGVNAGRCAAGQRH